MPDGSHDVVTSDLAEVLAGLGQAQKTLPSKLFYDAEGCRLFGEITRLPEYYPTRTEFGLLAKVAAALEPLKGCALIEFGGSDESKAIVLLDPLEASAYVPIDVAAPALEAIVERLSVGRPNLSVFPVVADFLRRISLPHEIADKHKFGFFPGSTIGNLDPEAATRFLVQARELLGPDGQLLIGVDLRKDPAILVPAYDDVQGVTAAFNRNILSHVNTLFDADFDASSFAHRAIWNDIDGRVEMHLTSSQNQSVSIAGMTIHFAEGETIHTENSYKHSVDGFRQVAAGAGWSPRRVWVDDANLFSLHLLTV